MSVLLLHNSPAAKAFLCRDHALVDCGAGYMLLRRSALTPELLTTLLDGGRPNPRVERTEHDLGEGYRLRVTHDCRIMGPPGMRNVGPGEYRAPWGIWLVYKGSDISNCAPVLEEAVPHVLHLVQAFAAAEPAFHKVTYEAPVRPRARFKFAWSRDTLELAPLTSTVDRR